MEKNTNMKGFILLSGKFQEGVREGVKYSLVVDKYTTFRGWFLGRLFRRFHRCLTTARDLFLCYDRRVRLRTTINISLIVRRVRKSLEVMAPVSLSFYLKEQIKRKETK